MLLCVNNTHFRRTTEERGNRRNARIYYIIQEVFKNSSRARVIQVLRTTHYYYIKMYLMTIHLCTTPEPCPDAQQLSFVKAILPGGGDDEVRSFDDLSLKK